jgi:plastocyanin domain-containing protein
MPFFSSRSLPELWAPLSLLLALGISSACRDGSPGARPDPGARTVTPVKVDDAGFHPSQVLVPRGRPATLVFTRTSENTCATEVAFPELSLRAALPLNIPVTIEVPTNQARTLVFTCGMGMYKSSVLVR